jgi:putative tryptophan/tyrosine transport system substrate-binding protein
MTKTLKWLCVAAMIAALMVPGAAMAKTFRIGVSVIVDHPALAADQKGFEQALKDNGVMATYDYQNAQGDMSNAQAIARKFKGDDLDLVHSIATPTSQAVVKVITMTPVVYSSVTDPVDAGLVKTMGPAGGNVTGVSDAWPYDRQVKLSSEMVPTAKKWGTIYNAGDANSVKSISWAKAAMKKYGLEFIEVTVSTSAEVHMAAQSLADRVDAVFIISDNTVVSAFESLVKVCTDKKTPLFGGGVESVPRGSIAALGFDYFQVGYTAGLKAVDILKSGKKAGDIPSSLTKKLELVVNPKAANAQGLKLDPKFIEMADEIVE